MVISDLLEKIGGVPIPNYKKYIELEITGETEDGIDVVMPTFKYMHKG